MLCHYLLKFGTYRYLSRKDIMFLVKKNKTNVSKKNRYQENIMSKIFKRIINNHSLFDWQKTNARHIYLSRRDQRSRKFTVRWRYLWKTTTYFQIMLTSNFVKLAEEYSPSNSVSLKILSWCQILSAKKCMWNLN